MDGEERIMKRLPYVSAPLMPYSPLDALVNCLHDVRKAAKVRPGDTASTVDQRIADVFRPIVKRIQEEAVKNAQIGDRRQFTVDYDFLLKLWRATGSVPQGVNQLCAGVYEQNRDAYLSLEILFDSSLLEGQRGIGSRCLRHNIPWQIMRSGVRYCSDCRKEQGQPPIK